MKKDGWVGVVAVAAGRAPATEGVVGAAVAPALLLPRVDARPPGPRRPVPRPYT
jgi:hypothetical protein